MLWLSHNQFPGSGLQAGSQSRRSPSCLCQLHRAYLCGQTLSSRFQGTKRSLQANRAQGWHSGLCGQFSRTWGLQGTPDWECAAWRSLEGSIGWRCPEGSHCLASLCPFPSLALACTGSSESVCSPAIRGMKEVCLFYTDTERHTLFIMNEKRIL